MFDNTAAACPIVVGGLIFCISATPQPGCLFPLFHAAAAARPVKGKLSVLDPAVRLPPNHEEASVSSVSCLNMTFLVNEAR